MIKSFTTIALLILIIVDLYPQSNDSEDINIISEVNPFVEKGTKVLALDSADLNGDGKMDYVLILDILESNSDNNVEEGDRSLRLLIRKPNNTLYIAKRNDNIVYCSYCGGVLGDPFESLKTGLETFTIRNYGGSAWQWWSSYKFNYSKVDNTWLLVRVEEGSLNTWTPNSLKKSVYTFPKNFGKIDISDFDHDNYLKKEVNK